MASGAVCRGTGRTGMQRKVVSCLALVLAVLAPFPGCGPDLPEGVDKKDLAPVHIPDPNLADLILLTAYKDFVAHQEAWDSFEAINNRMNSITIEEARSAMPLNKLVCRIVGTLAAEGLPISSLEGIQHCENLADLKLVNCGISDISPLAALSNLHKLDLSANEIRDLSPLGRFTQFGILDLNRNRVEDITPLHNMRFGFLMLDGNRLSDVAMLEHVECSELYLSDNLISDLPPLDNVGLSKLVIMNNPLSDFACDKVRFYESSGSIENVIYDCKPGFAGAPATSPEYEGVVYTANGVYHKDKECEALKGKDIGMTKAASARDRGMKACELCL